MLFFPAPKGPVINQEHLALVEPIMQFADKEIHPNAERWDEEGKVPKGVIKKPLTRNISRCRNRCGLSWSDLPDQRHPVSNGTPLFRSLQS